MTDATKASLLLGTLLAFTLGSGAWGVHQSRRAAAAQARANREQGRADALAQAEVQATSKAKAAEQCVALREAEVARLRDELAHRPMPPVAEPVPPDAAAPLVVAGLQSLGLHPQLLGGELAIGLSLPDSRTTLTWGREAQRVPALAARLETLEELTRAQEGATGALHQQLAATQDARAAADARAEAQQHRADALQEALGLRPLDRPWSVTFLVGLDTSGTRRYGAHAARRWGPVHADVVILGNTVAVGGGVSF